MITHTTATNKKHKGIQINSILHVKELKNNCHFFNGTIKNENRLQTGKKDNHYDQLKKV